MQITIDLSRSVVFGKGCEMRSVCFYSVFRPLLCKQKRQVNLTLCKLFTFRSAV
jgi:hypothetical protein